MRGSSCQEAVGNRTVNSSQNSSVASTSSNPGHTAVRVSKSVLVRVGSCGETVGNRSVNNCQNFPVTGTSLNPGPCAQSQTAVHVSKSVLVQGATPGSGRTFIRTPVACKSQRVRGSSNQSTSDETTPSKFFLVYKY